MKFSCAASGRTALAPGSSRLDGRSLPVAALTSDGLRPIPGRRADGFFVHASIVIRAIFIGRSITGKPVAAVASTAAAAARAAGAVRTLFETPVPMPAAASRTVRAIATRPVVLWTSFAAIGLVVFLETRLWLVDRFPYFLDEGILGLYAEEGRNPDQRFISLTAGVRPGLVWMTLAGMSVHIHPLVAIRLSVVLFGLLITVCGTVVAYRYIGTTGAIAFGLLALFTPFLFLYESLGLRDPVIAGLMVAAFLLELELARRPRLWIGLLLGLTFGLGFLVKESGRAALVLLPLSLAYFPFRSPQRARLAAAWVGNVALALFVAFLATRLMKLLEHVRQPRRRRALGRGDANVRGHPRPSAAVLHPVVARCAPGADRVPDVAGDRARARRARPRALAADALHGARRGVGAGPARRSDLAGGQRLRALPGARDPLHPPARRDRRERARRPRHGPVGIDEADARRLRRRGGAAARAGADLRRADLVRPRERLVSAAGQGRRSSPAGRPASAPSSSSTSSRSSRPTDPFVLLSDPDYDPYQVMVLATERHLQIDWRSPDDEDANDAQGFLSEGNPLPTGFGKFREVWRYDRPHDGTPIILYARERDLSRKISTFSFRNANDRHLEAGASRGGSARSSSRRRCAPGSAPGGRRSSG